MASNRLTTMSFSTRSSIVIVVVWVILTTCLTLVAPRWKDVVEDGNLAYFPKEFSLRKADSHLRRHSAKHMRVGKSS